MIEKRFKHGIKLRHFFPQDILEGLLDLINNPPQIDQEKTVPLNHMVDGKEIPTDKKLGLYSRQNNPIVQRANDFCIKYFHTHKESIIVKEGNGWVDFDEDESPYTMNGELQTTPPQCRYGCHQDTHHKLHTLIIYLHPQDGNGTIFYDDMNKQKTRGLGGEEDPWEINSGYWMGIDFERPWHSYQNNTDETRWVFMLNVGKKVKIPLDNR